MNDGYDQIADTNKWNVAVFWNVFETSVNSLRPSDACMRRYTNHHWLRKWLVDWTAPSHYLNQCWDIVHWTLRNQLQWIFNRNSNIFIDKNMLENVVCHMLLGSSRPQCVKSEPIQLSWVSKDVIYFVPKKNFQLKSYTLSTPVFHPF